MRQQAAADRKANRVAVRTAQTERRQDARQQKQLVKIEQANAAALAQTQEAPGATELIDERAAKRRAMLAGGFSAYGFRRGSGMGLGGGSPMLGGV